MPIHHKCVWICKLFYHSLSIFYNYNHREGNVAFLITDSSHIFMCMGFLKDADGKDERMLKKKNWVSDILSCSWDRLIQISTYYWLLFFVIATRRHQHLILRKTAIAINSRIASCQLDSTVCQDCHPCYENLVFLFLFWKIVLLMLSDGIQQVWCWQ